MADTYLVCQKLIFEWFFIPLALYYPPGALAEGGFCHSRFCRRRRRRLSVSKQVHVPLGPLSRSWWHSHHRTLVPTTTCGVTDRSVDQRSKVIFCVFRTFPLLFTWKPVQTLSYQVFRSYSPGILCKVSLTFSLLFKQVYYFSNKSYLLQIQMAEFDETWYVGSGGCK